MTTFKAPGNFYKPEPEQSLFNQVKFLDKVWIPDGAILVDGTHPHRLGDHTHPHRLGDHTRPHRLEDYARDYTHTHSDELFICHYFHEMFRYLNRMYPRKKKDRPSFFKIYIYNLNADNINPKEDTTYRLSKDILCKHAYCRRLFFSWDLKEVYCEAFTVGDGSYRFENNYIYDYGLLYGDYPRYENLDIVNSDYIRKSPQKMPYYISECKKFFIGGVPPEDLDLKINTNTDIHCIYRVWDSMGLHAKSCCLPVATFTKAGHYTAKAP